jgi:hypothetical protein
MLTVENAKHFVRNKPLLYHMSPRFRRTLGVKTPAYLFLDCFSKLRARQVHFVHIGASDGLRSGPIRELVVRDHWSGVSVAINCNYLEHKDQLRQAFGALILETER